MGTFAYRTARVPSRWRCSPTAITLRWRIRLRGYLYLCQLFASHGIIAATIDANFLNGFNFGENDARAIVHLEHLKQFRAWHGAHHHLCRSKIGFGPLTCMFRRPGDTG